MQWTDRDEPKMKPKPLATWQDRVPTFTPSALAWPAKARAPARAAPANKDLVMCAGFRTMSRFPPLWLRRRHELDGSAPALPACNLLGGVDLPPPLESLGRAGVGLLQRGIPVPQVVE